MKNQNFIGYPRTGENNPDPDNFQEGSEEQGTSTHSLSMKADSEWKSRLFEEEEEEETVNDEVNQDEEE